MADTKQVLSVGPSMQEVVEPVRKSVRVRANAERAFRVFTKDMGSWWPRTHHIGKSPMTGIVIEGRPGGTIYSDQEDGTKCPWGTVLVWDPPRRLVFAWQVTPTWQFEPDLEKCSEVELLFTPADDGTTLVELEHRHFEKHGTGHAQMRDTVNGDGGWGTLLSLYAQQTETQ